MKDPSKPVVNWGRKNDIVEQITEDLTPQRGRKKKVEEQGGDDTVCFSRAPTTCDRHL